MPIRIQRKRTKGWRMPENTVYVGRPTKWGNEWTVKKGRTAKDCVKLFRSKLTSMKSEYLEELVKDLRGYDLACWCKVGEPCHADVLLELANPQ